MRTPSAIELVTWVCQIQPELDHDAAVELLRLDGVEDWVTQRWHEQRVTADSLLGLHLGLHEEQVA